MSDLETIHLQDGSPEYRIALIEAVGEAFNGWNQYRSGVHADSLSGRIVGALLKRGLRIYPLAAPPRGLTVERLAALLQESGWMAGRSPMGLAAWLLPRLEL